MAVTDPWHGKGENEVVEGAAHFLVNTKEQTGCSEEQTDAASVLFYSNTRTTIVV
jgi:hypothetical protein